MSPEQSSTQLRNSSAHAAAWDAVLDPAVIDEIAARFTDAVVARVVEIVTAEGVTVQVGTERGWLNAQEVAQRLGVSRSWVYVHAEHLGAHRIGTGPQARLRFPAQILEAPGLARPNPAEQPGAAAEGTT